ncbi:MAG: tRNA preQ1(34) S-adenosylmethionine ribosyltransferase-isomerase QueA [Bryobacterales bacterium]|nr:tRNA preQ1(34) S-adenosylmethionine ribosyltransferase-isomerase QueA [Bryobacterales bacterium]
MNLSDFDYPLPAGLIAQEPLEDRAGSRMLVVNRAAGTWQDHMFRDLPGFLRPGDCLVLNDSRVIPCRLLGDAGGHAVEVFLLRKLDHGGHTWLALGKPGKRLRPGASVKVGPQLEIRILETRERGERVVEVRGDGDVDSILESAGHMPLPPYIHRNDRPEDRTRYQTIYARQPGSSAAPTAGLHFTPQVLEQCRGAGATAARVTLHVGLGTFQPLREEHVEENRLHSEWFEVSPEASQAISAAHRVIAVGTTSARVLESASVSGRVEPVSGETDLFIYPGYTFRATAAMLTNFHLPRSSLLLLVSAFGGRELILGAYHHAVRNRYRFFSYGDCMLIL